jgi:amidohydrolase
LVRVPYFYRFNPWYAHIRLPFIVVFYFNVFGQQSASTTRQVNALVDRQYSSLEKLYKSLHQQPELSLQEIKTSQVMAQELRALGFQVIEKIGGYSLAGVLKNGEGPTVLIRTDMDALPQQEKTGLPYASNVKAVNALGAEVPVMHACGHDMHMTVFIGTARTLAETRTQWRGTLVMVAQSSEENGVGAELMFKDGLYEKVPYPDYALAFHNHAGMAAGTVGYNTGPFMASVDMMNITVYGKGGHGAVPHTTIDPVVLSAQMVMAFQTIVSREINPLESAVITVGSIHGGTVHNIIPDEVKLQLTLRTYDPAIREKIISSIRNKSRYLALQAGLPDDKVPAISFNEPSTPATINDKVLTERLVTVLKPALGEQQIIETPPSMIGEDFSRFGLQSKKVPICMFWLGTVDREALRTANEKGATLPSLHSSTFAPSVEPTIKTGVTAMSLCVMSLLKR